MKNRIVCVLTTTHYYECYEKFNPKDKDWESEETYEYSLVTHDVDDRLFGGLRVDVSEYLLEGTPLGSYVLLSNETA